MIESDPFEHDSFDESDGSTAQLIGFYWGLLRRYYWILLLASIIVVTGGYFFTKQQPRLFKAESKIIFHQNQSNVFGRNIERVDVMDPGGRWQFEHFWNTQRQILRSDWFLGRVVENMDGLKDERLAPLKSSQGADFTPEQRLEMASGVIEGMTELALLDDSRVAVVTVTSSDPTLAAEVANIYAETYVDYTQEFQSQGVKQIATYFDERVTSAQQQVLDARSKIHEFDSKHANVIRTSFDDEKRRTASDIDSANTELNDVENKLAVQEALLAQIRQMEKEGQSKTDIAEFAGSESLPELVSQQRDLRKKLAEHLTVFGERHEVVVGTKDQLAIVDKAIEEEVNRSISSVVNKVQFLKRQRTSIQQRLKKHEEKAAELKELGTGFGELKDRAQVVQDTYDKVMKRSEELNINATYNGAVVELLEAAVIPKGPFSPNLPYNLGVSLLLGLLLGGGVIFLIAVLDNTVKGEEDVRRYTSAPLIGALPEVDASTIKSLMGASESPLDIITHLAPKSSFAEGIKTVRTNLMFMYADNKAPTFSLVTSPGPGEGKTLISTNMAIAIAQSGKRTLLIDNDLRRPRIHKAVGIKNTIGLADVLAKETTLDEAVQPTEIENLFVMPAGHIPPNPTELLHTERFGHVLEELREKYDRVIFDSPPIGAVADALILSQTVDAVLLVLKFGQTRKDILKRSIEQLEGIGAPLVGCVLNDIKREAGYGYQYYYYHRYGYDDRPGDDDKKIKKLHAS